MNGTDKLFKSVATARQQKSHRCNNAGHKKMASIPVNSQPFEINKNETKTICRKTNTKYNLSVSENLTKNASKWI